MIPGYTEYAKKVISMSEDTAKRFNGGYVGTEHILMGLILSEGASRDILIQNGLDKDRIFSFTLEIADTSIEKSEKYEYSLKAKKLLEASQREAVRLGHETVGTEHILLALLKDKDCMAYKTIHEMGLNIQKIYLDCMKSLGFSTAQARNDYMSERKYSGGKGRTSTKILDKYGKNLNQYAEEGKLDPVICREAELEGVIRILSRRTKNNPCLIGEAGVGKTAIVEALAQRIVAGEVPEYLKTYKVYTIDMSGMVAGSKFRGEFEDRIKGVISEAVNCGDILLFIDEIHSIIGAGGAEGALDASNILKPYLARGELQIIGATTTDEYRKHIEKDAALERRFQPIMVEEPSEESCIEILKGIRSRYEEHHRVKITDDAVICAVRYSKRYVADRFLPDKAIDAMDEAASKLRTGVFSDYKALANLDMKINEANLKLEEALKESKFGKASRIKKEIEEIREKQEEIKSRKEKMANNKKLNQVTEEEIAQVISEWTKIPVRSLKEDEIRKLKKLEDILHKRVVGQNEAVEAVAKAVRRGRLGLKNPNRPIGSFLFLGPTGVGKTELSKALAEAVFGSENDIIRVDMSEYMEKHSVSKMVGSPPGYVGFEDGGQLSEKIRRKPYSVLLFDEIEKAHPDVFNMLLQVLEDGHITDAQGRKVSFKDTIIIMTSNAGAGRIMSPKLLGFASAADEEADYRKMKAGVLEEVKKIFKPEFINRIDEMLVFHALTKENITSITKLMLNELSARVMQNMDISLVFRKNVYEHIAEKGFDKDYGARPVRRAIQKEIEDGLAMAVLDEKVKKGTKVKVSYTKDGMQFEECE